MSTKAPTLHSHQVDIFYDFNPTPICSGTLISSYLILTLASCLANKKVLKLTVQTQNLSQLQLPSHRRRPDYYEDEDEEKEVQSRIQTRYVDSFYPIQALSPNGTYQSEHQLAVIVLDEELQWSGNVKKAHLLTVSDKLQQIYQPFKCFSNEDVKEKSPIPAQVFVQEKAFSNCMSGEDEASLSSHIFPSRCLAETSRSSGYSKNNNNNLKCPAPLPGSGLFCHALRQEDGEEKNVTVLCGVLGFSSDRREPLYINMNPYLHGIYLPDDNDNNHDENKNEDEAHSYTFGSRLDFRATSVPYQLSLQQRRQGKWEHQCGAVLLDERTALTAAQCFDFDSNRNPAHFRLVAGMTMRELGEDGNAYGNDGSDPTHQILPLQKITSHEQWNGNFSSGNDIALLTVEGSFVLNENVSPVWISSPDDPLLSDFNGTATGWGKTSDSSGLSNSLMVVNLPLLPDENCTSILDFYKDSMICTHTGVSNICAGDAGGPLVLKNYEFPDGLQRDLLVGITSFGPKECEDLSKPSGFTRVSSFYEWINSNWKRNTTAPNKFKCFDGQEIDNDLKCDDEFDCADGSDEKGCNTKPIKYKTSTSFILNLLFNLFNSA